MNSNRHYTKELNYSISDLERSGVKMNNISITQPNDKSLLKSVNESKLTVKSKRYMQHTQSSNKKVDLTMQSFTGGP